MATSIPAPVVATHLRQYLVPPEELEFGEYVFAIKLTNEKTKHHFYQIITALLNTSGGVIKIDLGVSLDSKCFDKWRNNLREQLLKFMTNDVYIECISLEVQNDLLHMLVIKSKVFITTASFLFTRGAGGETLAMVCHQNITPILGQPVHRGEPALFPRIGPYKYMEICEVPERMNLEFKCFSCITANDLIGKLKEQRVEKTLFAMGNVRGGGEIIIGVQEPSLKASSTTEQSHQRSRFMGQELLTDDEGEFISELENHLKNASINSNRVWGETKLVPIKGQHWDCDFIPLGAPPYICQPWCKFCPHRIRRVLICIRIFQCPGGLFAKRPESFTIRDDGEIIQVPFEEWRTKHKRRRETIKTTHTKTTVSIKTHATKETTDNPPTAQATTGAVELSDVFEDGMKISFKDHSSRSEVLDVKQGYSDHHKQRTYIFEPTCPVHFTPSRDEIQKYVSLKYNRNLFQAIGDGLSGQTGFGIADDTLFDCIEHNVNLASFTSASTSQQILSFKPSEHIMDLLVVTNLTQMFLYVICSALGTDNWLIAYTMVLARILKTKLLQRLGPAADYKAVNIICKIVSLDGFRPHCSPDYYHRWFTESGSRNLTYISTSLAEILSQVKTHFRDAIHLGADMILSQEQSQALLSIDSNRFNIIEGPPGCGKTLLARQVCVNKGRENSAYISACVALNTRVGASKEIEVFYATESSHILSLLQENLKDKKHIVIDDNHNYVYTNNIAEQICDTVAVKGMTLYVFEDSKYQNYKHQATPRTLQCVMRSEMYGACFRKTLTEIRRNSQVVGSFLKAQVSSLLVREDINDLKCVSALIGDDIVMKHVSRLRLQNKDNGLVQHIKQLVTKPLDKSRRCNISDIVVLIDHQDNDKEMEDVGMYRELFQNVWPESNVQGATDYPVEGVIVDTLTNFAGLESKVVVFVMPTSTDTTETINNTKHRIAVASRGIERIDFVREENLDKTIAENMRCDLCPPSYFKVLQNAMKKPARMLGVQEGISSVSVNADGEFICCTRHSVVIYSTGGARSEFHAPPLNPQSQSTSYIWSDPDTLLPFSVAIHPMTGDVVVAYHTRTQPSTVYLDVFNKASKSWSPPHRLGEGEMPRVTWAQTGRVAVGVRDIRGNYLVLYDITHQAEVWRRAVEDWIRDVTMYREYICCCPSFVIPVYNQDGALSRTLELLAPGRLFSQLVSVCEGGEGRLLVLHREEVNGKGMGVVTAWSETGQYVQDIVTGLPWPRDWDCVRLHGQTLCVSLDEEQSIVCYQLRQESSSSATTL